MCMVQRSPCFRIAFDSPFYEHYLGACSQSRDDSNIKTPNRSFSFGGEAEVFSERKRNREAVEEAKNQNSNPCQRWVFPGFHRFGTVRKIKVGLIWQKVLTNKNSEIIFDTKSRASGVHFKLGDAEYFWTPSFTSRRTWYHSDMFLTATC